LSVSLPEECCSR